MMIARGRLNPALSLVRMIRPAQTIFVQQYLNHDRLISLNAQQFYSSMNKSPPPPPPPPPPPHHSLTPLITLLDDKDESDNLTASATSKLSNALALESKKTVKLGGSTTQHTQRTTRLIKFARSPVWQPPHNNDEIWRLLQLRIVGNVIRGNPLPRR